MGPKTANIAALLLLCGIHCICGAPAGSQWEPASSSPGNNPDDSAPSSPPTTSATTITDTTTTTTTQLNARTRPSRRPPPPTDNPEEQPEQGHGTLQVIAEGTKTSAHEATRAASIMNRYLMEYLHGNLSAMPPCFIVERESGEFDGHHNPAVDYLQKLKVDYESLEWYNSYWDYVEQKNSTNTNPGYQTRFMAVRTRNNLLLDSMTSLFGAANITIPECTVGGEGAGEEGERSSLFPKHCYSTSYEQQARIYLRYQTLTSEYIINDIDGVLQQKAGN